MDYAAGHDTKERIRQAVDIVDLVGGYLQLRRQGRIYVAHCPWHDDTRPSLQVNPERQTFKCWVCDIGGDVFSFLMRMERLEFREALEMLAERTGIPLEQRPTAATQAGGPGDKRTQLAAVEWAAELFRRQLTGSPQAECARRYLAERGIAESMQQRFRLGFSPPDWQWLVQHGRQGPFSLAVLERVGLLGTRESDRSHYDRFRGRLMFPICDVRGRPIAFGGRVLPEFADERSAKYVNSPETPLYSKSQQLYALDLARDSIAKSGCAVVMEGYTDVIMAHQYGITNAVACCGTSLGEQHLRLLRRFTDQVVLVLDGDEAGQKRASEMLELFVANQIDVRILTLPDGLDPCDFLRAEGAEAWQALVETACDALEHKLKQIERRVGRNPSIHVAAEAVEELLGVLAKVPVAAGQTTSAALVREQQVLGRVARRFHLQEEDLRARLKSLRQSSRRLTRPTANDPPAGERTATTAPAVLSLWEQEIFELVLSDSQLVGPIIQAIPKAAMVSRAAVWLYAHCEELHSRHEPVTFDRLMARAENDHQQKLLIDLDESAQQKCDSDHNQRLQDLVEHYRLHHEQQTRRVDLAHLREGTLDSAEEEQLLQAYFDNLKRRQAGSLSTDG